MGEGKEYYCKRCNEEYSVFLGIGMMFPQVFRRIQQKVRSGKYGKKW